MVEANSALLSGPVDPKKGLENPKNGLKKQWLLESQSAWHARRVCAHGEGMHFVYLLVMLLALLFGLLLALDVLHWLMSSSTCTQERPVNRCVCLCLCVRA
jgi:hypothetical protein